MVVAYLHTDGWAEIWDGLMKGRARGLCEFRRNQLVPHTPPSELVEVTWQKLGTSRGERWTRDHEMPTAVWRLEGLEQFGEVPSVSLTYPLHNPTAAFLTRE